VKYTDPDGKDFYNLTEKYFIVIPEDSKDKAVIVGPNEMFRGEIDGAIMTDDMTIIKVNDLASIIIKNVDDVDTAFTPGLINEIGDFVKEKLDRGDLPSGIYKPGSKNYQNLLLDWGRRAENLDEKSTKVSEMNKRERNFAETAFVRKLQERN